MTVSRLPDELFSAILKLNKRRAISERLERIARRTVSYVRDPGLDDFYMFHVVNGDHRRSMGFLRRELQSEIVMFRQRDDAEFLTFHVYMTSVDPTVRYQKSVRT